MISRTVILEGFAKARHFVIPELVSGSPTIAEDLKTGRSTVLTGQEGTRK